jgi:hypothetical protein
VLVGNNTTTKHSEVTMSNNKQSSIELFAIAIYEKFKMEGNGNELNDLFEQYKAMHKEEIKDAFTNGYIFSKHSNRIADEQYYELTYGGNNEQQ